MSPPRSDATRGILLFIAALIVFSTMDVLGKSISHRTDTVMAIWARYLGQAVVVLLIVSPRLKTVAKTKYPKLQFLRSVFLLMGTACYFFGFVLIGLAPAAAIFNVNPILVTLGAAFILGEQFGPRRAIAVVVALIGALIIIRPGTDVFSPYSLLPLIAACSYTGYAITTRFVGRDEDAWTSLLYTAAFGAVVVSFVVPFFWVRPDAATVLMMLSIGVLGSLGHLCFIRAFTAAEASVLAPITYFGLLFATLYGMIFFGEYPDLATYIGALVIVGAGLYVWHRETKAAKADS